MRAEMRKNGSGNKGPTTYAEYIQQLAQCGSYSSSQKLDTELQKLKDDFSIAHIEQTDAFHFAPPSANVKFPAQIAEQTPEKYLGEASKLSAEERVAEVSNAKLMENLQEPQSTQDFVSAVLVKLAEEKTVYFHKKIKTKKGKSMTTIIPKSFQMTSFPSPMAYVQKSFENRSPDLPFRSYSNTSSPHCITFMLDVKPCEPNKEFTDDQKGHIVDMVRELLTSVQKSRRGMICGLSDGSRFQYFRVLLLPDGIQVEASRSYIGDDGWQVQLVYSIYTSLLVSLFLLCFNSMLYCTAPFRFSSRSWRCHWITPF